MSGAKTGDRVSAASRLLGVCGAIGRIVVIVCRCIESEWGMYGAIVSFV